MRIRSFGCSFIFGNDLHDDGRDGPHATASQHTWPALIAKELGMEYVCNARGGSGNMHIADKVMMRATQRWPNEIFVVQWSYIDRFDWIDVLEHQDHHHINNGWRSILPGDRKPQADFYFRTFHTQLFDLYRSLTVMATTVDMLERLQQPYIMCCVDPLVFDRRYALPPTLVHLQDYLQPKMLDFQGSNFVHWSRAQGFAISPVGHPLEQAHAAAAQLMLPHLQNKKEQLCQRKES